MECKLRKNDVYLQKKNSCFMSLMKVRNMQAQDLRHAKPQVFSATSINSFSKLVHSVRHMCLNKAINHSVSNKVATGEKNGVIDKRRDRRKQTQVHRQKTGPKTANSGTSPSSINLLDFGKRAAQAHQPVSIAMKIALSLLSVLSVALLAQGTPLSADQHWASFKVSMTI